ncbi:DUF2199 domain-containing protein [Roseovarius phycicola]|uniref:DUF2199 domain-containing protein n=1 Tax=Roseovarius phycicola TaxID=3080976 RepID=A0ABZ2HH22_9RHOB
MIDLANDPRWQRFNDTGYECPCCGESFDGIFDIAFDHPEVWPHGNRAQSGEATLTIGEDKLGSEYCVYNEHRFVRCLVELPIFGSSERFAFGAWGSLHPDNFTAYVQAVQDNTEDRFEGCFSWLSNALPGFSDCDSIGCDFKPIDTRTRPRLWAQDGPLRDAQVKGITFDQLLDIYQESGSDIRPHLMQS